MAMKSAIQQLSRSQSLRRLYARLRSTPVGPSLHWLVQSVLPPETRIWVPISDGAGSELWAHIDPRFEIDYADEKYEAPIQKVISECLETGGVFYDVGAHIGILSMFAARLVGKQGSVFAFEADPQNAKRIGEHVSRNELGQLQIVPCAVWSSTRSLQFERASAHSSRNQGAVVAGSSANGGNTIEVEAVALDDFVKSHPSPTLIKIDVEGAEIDVLRGSEEIFAQTRPIVICEVHHEKAEQEVTRWLSEKDYRFEWLENWRHFPRHLLAKWKS